MENNDAIQLSGQSGQRKGTDRRKTNDPVWEDQDRRSGYDRRKKWPLINEWSSTLNRNEALDR